MFKRIISYFKKYKAGAVLKTNSNLLLCITGSSKSREKLVELAYTDLMTGCYNRNALEEHRDTFDNMELYVGVVDINGLKMINDIQGHERGDMLIQTVADRLKALDAIVIRLGGDEFLVLSIKHVLFYVKDASIGIAYKAAGDPLKQAMKIADECMYLDKKRKGR